MDAPERCLTELIATGDRAEQEEILLRNEALILDGIVPLLARVEHPDLIGLRVAIAEAIESYRSGYYWAAQALAGATLTTTIHEAYDHRTFKQAREAFAEMDPEEASLRTWRLAVITTAVVRTLDTYHPGDPVPILFNRHASTHRVGAPQYRQLNSLTSLMLVVSFLLETQTALEAIEAQAT